MTYRKARVPYVKQAESVRGLDVGRRDGLPATLNAKSITITYGRTVLELARF